MTHPWPDLAVLDLLVTTGRTGSLTAAARERGLAQPNASRAISRLERQLGLVLLLRSHTGSTLSADGEQLARAAEPLLARADEWRVTAQRLAAQAGAELEFAASQTVAEYLAPGWVARHRRAHPHTELRMLVTNSAQVVALVLTHAVAVGFLESPEVPPQLSSATVHTDRLCVVVPPGHRWARRRRPLELDELAGAPLVVRELGSGTRETLEAALSRLVPGAGAAHPGLVLSSNAAVLGACAAGAGPAVLSELAVSQAVAAGTVVQVRLAEPEALARELRAVWLGARPAPAAAELVRLARTAGA